MEEGQELEMGGVEGPERGLRGHTDHRALVPCGSSMRSARAPEYCGMGHGRLPALCGREDGQMLVPYGREDGRMLVPYGREREQERALRGRVDAVQQLNDDYKEGVLTAQARTGAVMTHC